MAMFVCIAAISVFTSCKDEKSNAELIHGKWNVDKILSTVQKQKRVIYISPGNSSPMVLPFLP